MLVYVRDGRNMSGSILGLDGVSLRTVTFSRLVWIGRVDLRLFLTVALSG